MFVWVNLYPCVLHITLPKTAVFFCHETTFQNTTKGHNDMKFDKEVKMKFEISLTNLKLIKINFAPNGPFGKLSIYH